MTSKVATDAERNLLLTTLKKHYGEDAKVETRNFEHIGIKARTISTDWPCVHASGSLRLGVV
eukprot:9010535-Prorocentrum_lima.AAC.1